MEHVDTVIVGQGIAGTSLAWQLLWRGRTVRIIERGDRAAILGSTAVREAYLGAHVEAA